VEADHNSPQGLVDYNNPVVARILPLVDTAVANWVVDYIVVVLVAVAVAHYMGLVAPMVVVLAVVQVGDTLNPRVVAGGQVQRQEGVKMAAYPDDRLQIEA